MALPTISAGDLLNKGTTGMPANPELSFGDLQAKFDELSLDVIIPKFQALVTALENASAGVDLGVTAPTGITASDKVKSVLDAMAVILLALKGKSDGDYDDLVSIFAGVTMVSDIVDGLSTTIPTAKAITDFIQNIGLGDMLRTVYDTDNNGIVDNSEKLGNQLPAYYASQQDLVNINTEFAQTVTQINNDLNDKPSKSKINYNNLINVVADYNADNGGIIDSSLAFIDAINQANANGKSIYVPSGKYIINNDLPDINNSVSIIGDLDNQNTNNSGTYINDRRESTVKALFNFTNGTAGGQISNICFQCYNPNYLNTTCIKTTSSGWDFRIEKCTFLNFNIAMDLQGNDTVIINVKIAFCGFDNYAFINNTNACYVFGLHIEHCRLMLYQPNIYTFGVRYISCKFEQSTFLANRNKLSPIVINGYNNYQPATFECCNFYFLDYTALITSSETLNDIVYAIRCDQIPSTLANTRYVVAKFDNCLFNIGAGSGGYSYIPISNNVAWIKSSSCYEITNCTFHNCSGDFESLSINNSYGFANNNKIHYAFINYSGTAYSSFCKTTKQIGTYYNVDFIKNEIFYSTELYPVSQTEIDKSNRFIDNYVPKVQLLCCGDTKMTSNNQPTNWVKLFTVDGISLGDTVYLDFTLLDSRNCYVYDVKFCAIGSGVNALNTGTWKLIGSSMFNTDVAGAFLATFVDGKLNIYYKANNRITAVNNCQFEVLLKQYSNQVNVKKYNSIVVETPILTGSYIYTT